MNWTLIVYVVYVVVWSVYDKLAQGASTLEF